MCRRLRSMLNSAYQWILKVQLAVGSRHSLMLTPYGKVVYFLSVSSKVLVILLGSKYGLSSVVGKMVVPPCPFTSFFFILIAIFFNILCIAISYLLQQVQASAFQHSSWQAKNVLQYACRPIGACGFEKGAASERESVIFSKKFSDNLRHSSIVGLKCT